VRQEWEKDSLCLSPSLPPPRLIILESKARYSSQIPMRQELGSYCVELLLDMIDLCPKTNLLLSTRAFPLRWAFGFKDTSWHFTGPCMQLGVDDRVDQYVAFHAELTCRRLAHPLSTSLLISDWIAEIHSLSGGANPGGLPRILSILIACVLHTRETSPCLDQRQ
jgi:hypothetical protein